MSENAPSEYKKPAKAPEPEKAPEEPVPPKPEAPLPKHKKEQTVQLDIAELHAFHTFGAHPFQVKDNAKMQDLASQIREIGIQHPLVVRPREAGGYEIISGHRRHRASELLGYEKVPCIVRNYDDFEAFKAMKAGNEQREETLPSEKAHLLAMELNAIKKQGARDGDGRRSDEVVGENNNMTGKQVQRYIKLTELNPDLMELVDSKKIGFTTAVELSFISQKSQLYIADAIESVGATPSLSQAQRMRELEKLGMLKPDAIDGIMLEEKKEEVRVIISSKELSQYFGPDQTPREMKEKIMSLLDDWAKTQPNVEKPDQEQDGEAR